MRHAGLAYVAVSSRQQRHACFNRVTHSLTQMTASIPTSSNAAPIAGPFREEMILRQLKTVRDPEIPVDIVNLGLVYSAMSTPLESGGNRIDVRMSLTAPGC